MLLTNTRLMQSELNEALADGRMVVVCWEPECRKHRLPHWGEDEWVECERNGRKHQYSHGICVHHEAKYRIDMDAYFARQHKLARPETIVAA